MKFWDSSAIIPLLVEQKFSERSSDTLIEDPAIVVWWGTSIECVSAISRLEREHVICDEEADQIITRLNTLRETWREIQPATKLKQIAERILRVHALKAQDAQQLAACILAHSDIKIPFITFDDNLTSAAKKEGLELV